MANRPKVIGGKGESTLNLNITFTATGDTEPLRAIEIARLIENYISVEMSAARVRVNVESAFLSYDEPYEERKAQIDQIMKDALS